jgi:hypothetical protein
LSKVVIESHVGEILNELASRKPVILEALAIEAEGNAVDEITALGAVKYDTPFLAHHST